MRLLLSFIFDSFSLFLVKCEVVNTICYLNFFDHSHVSFFIVISTVFTTLE